MHDVIEYFSDFGDENMLWPLIVLMSGLLLWQRRTGMLVRWIFLIGCVFGTMLLLKLRLEACGRLPGMLLYSPSGHTAGSTFVYGSIVILFSRHIRIGLGIAALFAIAMGSARVFLHVHTPLEVLVGAGMGWAGCAVLTVFRHRETLAETGFGNGSWAPPVLMGAGLILLTCLLHGVRSPAEEWIRMISQRFMAVMARCPPVNG